MKFQVKQGIFENTIFEGKIINDRIYNLETSGQSYPIANCKLIELYFNEVIENEIVVNKIEDIRGGFIYGLRLLNKKGEPIKGGKGAGGMKNINEFKLNN